MVFLRQQGTDHGTGGGFSNAAGDGHRLAADGLFIGRSHIPQGLSGILYDHLRKIQLQRVVAHRCGSAVVPSRRHIPVPVYLPFQCKEQRSLFRFP